ncbi:MAG: hypothetical protein Q8R76_03020 [Candidatus Omnitrophota bacterium]|nr:hypothetical protein [Candidatus Omnitrophota bacterium]
MIFHLGTEIPERSEATLDHERIELTKTEGDIIKTQIRKNSVLVDEYVGRLDLLLNKERYPQHAVFIKKIRRRLELLMDENNTFRKVLWAHLQREELSRISLHP